MIGKKVGGHDLEPGHSFRADSGPVMRVRRGTAEHGERDPGEPQHAERPFAFRQRCGDTDGQAAAGDRQAPRAGPIRLTACWPACATSPARTRLLPAGAADYQ